ncbi:MAG: proline dehydrogenase family protein [Acidobacteriota bacterium]|jgi:proline dehydrogenase
MSLIDRTLVATLPLLPRFLVRRFSARYIAGARLQDACRVVQDLNRQRIMGTVDLLGEDITREDEARQTALVYQEILTAIRDQGLDCNVSVKLTSLGMKIDRELCIEQMSGLLEHAGRLQNFIRIDMEDSSCTSDTLEIFRRLREHHDNVGVVIQAYMRRSVDDVDELIKLKANVRLCKGIYIEPRRIAYRDRVIVQHNFAFLLERLLEGGCYVGIATHDELLAWQGLRLVRSLGLHPSQYEFQMLLGVDEALRGILVDAGHRMRVYVPFGMRWYEYSMRRLKENPRIAGYAFRSFLGLS